MTKRNVMLILAVLALIAGGLMAWRHYRKPPPIPAATQAQEAITTATTAIAEAQESVKKGKAILKRFPGEVRKIEANAISAARSADLGTLADRANSRIREWVRQHPTGNADLSGAGGTVHGATVPGGGSPDQ